MNMTLEQQRIAIAEACPQAISRIGDLYFYAQHTIGQPAWAACKDNDPLTDLNAMHEAEQILTDGQYDTFEQELARVVGFRCHNERPVPSRLRLIISATAAQRREAFLRTLNFWKD